MSNFFNDVVKQEKAEQKHIEREKSLTGKLKKSLNYRKDSLLMGSSFEKSIKIKKKDSVLINNNLKKFEAVYIPTLPSSLRKSDS